jgi:hypothetical protein
MSARMACRPAKLWPKVTCFLPGQRYGDATGLGIRFNRPIGQRQHRLAFTNNLHTAFAEDIVQGFAASQQPG